MSSSTTTHRISTADGKKDRKHARPAAAAAPAKEPRVQSPTPEQQEEEEDISNADDGGEEKTHAAKRVKRPTLQLTSAPNSPERSQQKKKSTALVSASSAAAAASGDEKEEEKKDQQMVVADPQATTWTKETVNNTLQLFKRAEKVSPAIASADTLRLLISDEFPDPSEHIINVLNNKPFIVAMMKHGKVLTNCPNTATLLESLHYNRHIHFFEMWKDVATELQVNRQENKMSKESYINIRVKYPQNWCGVPIDLGYHFMTAFGKVLPFVQWGPTLDTGVQGSEGRVIEGSTVTPDAASYSNSIDNAMWHPHILNSHYDDSVLSTMLMWIEKVLFPDITMKTFADSKSMTKARARVMQQVANNPNLKAPTTHEEFAKLCMESPSFKLCLKKQQTSASFDVGCSVHRPAHDTYKGKDRDVSKDEDLTKIPYPTPMFEEKECRINKRNKKRQTHNRLPMMVARRAEDVDPKRAALPAGHPDAYTSAYESVPFENAVITRGDIAANLLQPSLYEDKFDKAGGKCRLKGWVWLNTQQGINDLLAKGPVAPVDPRFCIPCAGVYRGPQDKFKEQNAAYTANTAASAAAAVAAHVSDDEMHAAFASIDGTK